MSAQILEVLILAAVAFVVISKLMSVLGTTDEDEATPGNSAGSSFFGENKIKDVTNSVPDPSLSAEILRPNFNNAFLENEALDLEVQKLLASLPNFNIANFINGAQGAFKMALEALSSNHMEDINSLLDKRFRDKFITMKRHYGDYTASTITALITDAYAFGNSIYIKVHFTGQNVTSTLDNLDENWTFTKNINDSKPDWYISNIELSN